MKKGPLKKWQVEAAVDLMTKRHDLTWPKVIEMVSSDRGVRSTMPKYHTPDDPSSGGAPPKTIDHVARPGRPATAGGK